MATISLWYIDYFTHTGTRCRTGWWFIYMFLLLSLTPSCVQKPERSQEYTICFSVLSASHIMIWKYFLSKTSTLKFVLVLFNYLLSRVGAQMFLYPPIVTQGEDAKVGLISCCAV